MMNENVTLENYDELRRELVEANSNLLGVVMREKEFRLDALLTELKNEYRESCGGQIPFNIPVLSDPELISSRLYRFCSRLPKGADLHVHGLAGLPIPELIALLMKHPEFCINLDHKTYDLVLSDLSDTPPEGYARFPEALDAGTITRQELMDYWTVLGAEKSGENVWNYFETLFAKHRVLTRSPGFLSDYYDRLFRYYCEIHVMHVEIHLIVKGSQENALEYVRLIREAYYAVKREHPDFSVRIIGAGMKADNNDTEISKACFMNTVLAQETIRDESDPSHISDFVIGFDLVNEEDSNLPLRAFAPMLIQAKQTYPHMRFYIHGGESLNADNDNLIDAYLLGVSRVGHGLNLYRYPDLLQRYIRSEICLEVCPISNQTLGYTTDIRNHPATEYLRHGVALALCSDDPVYQEHETLTDDFFAATVGWNLSVADLKQLAINSIMYSGLESREKTAMLRAFNQQWNAFVDEILASGI